MNIEQVRAYALTLPGTTEDMPYGPDCVVFRIEGKIYLHIALESSEPRCAMNKVHWNDLYLNSLSDGMVTELIRHSYRLVLSKLPRRLRAKYEENH